MDSNLGSYGIKPDRLRHTQEVAAPRTYYERVRGCMKGTITIPPGVDLTEPADPEWAKVYDDE